MAARAEKKIFGIGFHKTGTTSLASSLRLLGYAVTGPNGVDNPRIAQDVHRMVDTLVPDYDAFVDNPWPIVYKYLDTHHPNNKFILTIRNTEEWLSSISIHFGAKETPMRQWIYGVGSPLGNEDIYRTRYEKHNREVVEYFRDRPGDLLVLRVTDGEGWEKLCPFLEREVPREPYPHLNRSGYRRKGTWLVNSVRSRMRRSRPQPGENAP